MSRDRTADFTYWADVAFFQRTTSGRLLHFVPISCVLIDKMVLRLTF